MDEQGTHQEKLMTSTTTDRAATRRWLGIGVLPVTLSLLLAACAGASPSASPPASVTSSQPASQPATQSTAPSEAASPSAGEAAFQLTVAQTSAGSSLAGENGMTLYTKADDTATSSTCSGSCATTWPPFTIDTGEQVTGATGVTGTISTITRDDGTLQVTYNGHPLYYYSGDTSAGDSAGQGLGGIWYIANPAM
jgi:predicted lipoprotein with Yx(FWY)xxD motif